MKYQREVKSSNKENHSTDNTIQLQDIWVNNEKEK